MRSFREVQLGLGTPACCLSKTSYTGIYVDTVAMLFLLSRCEYQNWFRALVYIILLEDKIKVWSIMMS